MTAHSKASDHPPSPALLRSDNAGVVTLTLNRAEARNTLSEALMAALSAEIAAIAVDKRARAIVLAANGPAFSAGHDLKEIAKHRNDSDGGRAYVKELMERCAELMMSLQRLPQPVIAAVEGVATAAGCQLVASCDIAVASKRAQFATPGVKIGLFCSTPMVALSRNVAPKHAMEMLLGGEMISAEDAYRIGLVNRVVSTGNALEGAVGLGRSLAAKSMMTIKLGKEAFYRQRELNLADAYKLTVDVMVENMLARDAEEGISAFLEKREPKWEDR